MLPENAGKIVGAREPAGFCDFGDGLGGARELLASDLQTTLIQPFHRSQPGFTFENAAKIDRIKSHGARPFRKPNDLWEASVGPSLRLQNLVHHPALLGESAADRRSQSIE